MPTATKHKVNPDAHFHLGTHNGFITIYNHNTGNWERFRIWTEEWDALDGDGKETHRVIARQCGTDRYDKASWQKFGFVSDDGRISVWKRHRGGVFDKFRRLLMRPDLGAKAGLEYSTDPHCRVCNQPLSSPEAIKKGIGPVCEKRQKAYEREMS